MPDSRDPLEDHSPNLTTSDEDPNLPQGTPALPRDPSQPIHKKPRVFIHRPSEDPDEETSAYNNTSYISALRTVSPYEDLKKVHQTPCFRDAMLPGIGGGMGIGVVRMVIGGSVLKGVNWASGSFLLVSFGMYQICQRRRRSEKEGIRKAVKVLDEKQKIKDAEDAAKKAQADKAIGPAAATTTAQDSFWRSFKFW